MVDRVSTFTQTQQITNNNLRIQSRYAKTQTQVSSGLKSDTYQGLTGDVARILSLESDYKTISTRSENEQTALDQTNVMFEKMGSILDVGQSFLADLSAAISTTGASASETQELATQALNQIIQVLNTQVTGRYLFSGSATARAPIDLSSYTGGTSTPSSTDSSYYQGNSYVQAVEISEGYSLSYGVTADNSAFEKIIRAISLVKNDPSNAAALTESYDLLNQGLDELSSLKAKTSQDAQTLDQSINDNLSDLNLIDSMISDLKEVDIAEVSVKLQELENQLSASYSVTTKLLDLKLSDYL